MRDVALVPERYVLKTDHAVCANNAREAADSLRQNWIALVRHGRRTLLPTLEFLLRLAHFRALPVPNRERELIQAGSCNSKRRKIFSVAVALYDLSRSGREC